MLEMMKNQLSKIEEAIIYAEETDTAWHPTYKKLIKVRRILKRTLRKLERLEAKSK